LRGMGGGFTTVALAVAVVVVVAASGGSALVPDPAEPLQPSPMTTARHMARIVALIE